MQKERTIVLTKENLNKLVADIIPEPYGPGQGFPPGSKGTFAYVTNVDYISKAKMSKWIQTDSGGDATNVHAIAMNWGIMKLKARSKDWEEAKLSHSIWISDELDVPTLALAFIILHEVGHVDWKVRRGELLSWKEEDQESYADVYAYERMCELYGQKAALETLTSYGSMHGLGSTTKEKQCLA